MKWKVVLIILIMFIGINTVSAGFTWLYPDSKNWDKPLTASFSPKFTNKTTVEIKYDGNPSNCNDAASDGWNKEHVCSDGWNHGDGGPDKIYTENYFKNKKWQKSGYTYTYQKDGKMSYDSPIYVIYKNVGTYNGKQVNMKITLYRVRINKQSKKVSFSFRTNKIGLWAFSSSDVAKIDSDARLWFHIKYYYNDGSTMESNFTNIINFEDIDYNEQIAIQKENTTAYGYAIKKGKTSYTHLKADRNKFDKYILFTGKGGMNEPLGGYFSGYRYGEVTYDKDCGNSCKNNSGSGSDYLPYIHKNFANIVNGSSYNSQGDTRYAKLFKMLGSLTVVSSKPEFNISWNQYWVNLGGSGFRSVKPTITKYVYDNKKNQWIKGTAYEKTGTTEVKFRINVNLPAQSGFKYNSIKITDKLDNKLTCDTSKITLPDNTFTVKCNGQKLEISKTFEGDGKSAKQNYTISVTAPVKSDYIAKDDKDLEVTNKADLNYQLNKTNMDGVTSNTVKASWTTDASCESRLNQIKSQCTNGKCTSNLVKIINELYELHDEFPKTEGKKSTNLLFNYNLYRENGNAVLDISNVSCGHYACETGNNTNISCGSGSIKENTTSGNVQSRVCYIADDASKNKGSYFYEPLSAYCNVSYDYNFTRFTPETVKSGQILWKTLNNDILGTVKATVICERAYSTRNDVTTAKENNNKKRLNPDTLFGDIMPYFDMSYTSAGKGYSISMSSEEVKEYKNDDSKFKFGSCVDVNGKTKCYFQLQGEYMFNVRYGTDLYLSGINGVFSTDGDISNKISEQGLPIAIDQSTKNNLTSKLSFTSNIYRASTSCPYNVYNEILVNNCLDGDCDDPKGLTKEFNFDFRVIDTTNPFPGASGNGRFTGYNWCASANIGKTLYDYSTGKYYVVGDINGDSKVDSSDKITNTTKTVNADIDGDGEVTYESGSCFANHQNLSDRCILERYVRADEKGCYGVSLYNSTIRDNITNAKNSYSTDEPMYSFTITSEDIQNIRDYNQKHAYDDFNLSCDGEKNECLSTFLTNWIKNKTVNGKSLSKSAQASVKSASCYETRIAGNWCGNDN